MASDNDDDKDDDDDANSKDVEVFEIGTGEALTTLAWQVSEPEITIKGRKVIGDRHFVRDICISVAHVSNRLSFDTFLLSKTIPLKIVLAMNELYCNKEIVTYFANVL